MKRRFQWIALALVALLPVGYSHAQPKPGKSETSTLTPTTDLNAIRLSVQNGIVGFVNNARQATLNLEWELLPTDKNLLAEIRENSPEKTTLRFSNRGLRDGSWLKSLSTPQQKTLSDALRVPDLSQLSLTSSEFESFWHVVGGKGTNLAVPEVGAGVPAISAFQYFGLMRDYLMVSGLFQSKGIRYSVDISEAKERTGNQKLSAEDGSDIRWEVDVYKFRATPDVNFYRFAARATMNPLPLLFPDQGDVSPKIEVAISFVKSPATIGLLQKTFRTLPGSMTIQLSPAVQKELDKVDENHSGSELGTTLKLITGGVDLGEVISKGLLGGTTNASIVSGGIIGSGKVSQIIGVNQELVKIGNSRAGLLLAFEPGGDRSLFVGPSLQFSIFTLAVGLRAFEKELADMSSKTTTTRISGALSIDLSRLTRSKVENTQIHLENSATGGDIGKASDLISRDLALIRYTLTATEPDASFELIQVEDGAGKKVAGDASAQLHIFPTAPGLPQILFVPRGKYLVSLHGMDATNPGVAFLLSAGGLPVPDGQILILSGDSPANINWKISKKP